ncbi:hypothetical protein ABPG72_015898 [Tetrahymena utriculariae]
MKNNSKLQKFQMLFMINLINNNHNTTNSFQDKSYIVYLNKKNIQKTYLQSYLMKLKKKIQNLEYLEKRRKIQNLFEKKVFQQPKEILNTVNLLISNVDFFENEEIKSIIPNYDQLILKTNSTQNFNSQLEEQVSNLVNKNCKIQQIIQDQSETIENAKENQISQIQEQLNDFYLFLDIQLKISQLKRDVNQMDIQAKGNIIQKLESGLNNFIQVQKEQETQKQREISFNQYLKIIIDIQVSNKHQQGKSIYSQKFLNNLLQKFFRDLLKNSIQLDNNNKNFQLSIVASEYGTKPFIQDQCVCFSNEDDGQAYFNIQLNRKKTYIVEFHIYPFKAASSPPLRFGLLDQNTINKPLKEFKTQQQFQNNHGLFAANSLFQPSISKNSNNNIHIQNPVVNTNIPEYLEMRINIEKSYLCISDYPSNKNCIKYEKEISQFCNYYLAFQYINDNQSPIIVSIQYFQESEEFKEF